MIHVKLEQQNNGSACNVLFRRHVGCNPKLSNAEHCRLIWVIHIEAPRV